MVSKNHFILFLLLISLQENSGATSIKNSLLFTAGAITSAALVYGIKKISDRAPAQKNITRVGHLILDGQIINSNDFVQALHAFVYNPEIAIIVITINSGGGASGSGSVLYNEIKKLKQIKPIIVLVENICLSAAYYAAAGADYIIAPSMSAVGSIGVWLEVEKHTDVKFDTKVYTGNSHFDVIYAGLQKVMTHPDAEPLTPEQRAVIQERINNLYDIFCNDIATARGLNLENRAQWAEGKIFSGPQALEIGLIDSVGTYSNVIEKIREILQRRNGSCGELVFVKMPQSHRNTQHGAAHVTDCCQ